MRSQDVIERLVLPNGARSTQKLVDASRRNTFDSLHDQRQRCIFEVEHKMHVVRHYDDDVHEDSIEMLIESVSKRERSRGRWQSPSSRRCGCDEERRRAWDDVR